MRSAILPALFLASLTLGDAAAQAPVAPDPVAAAKAALAQIDGTILVSGTREPVEVIRDRYGVPHIYAQNTGDLFFAQGFVVAQDRMWQLEMWRRNGEGRLAEVLGKDYVNRDTFARLLQFRGDWDAEYRKYHPQGKLIFDSFAKGVNAAIQRAIDEKKVPVEFARMGFAPQPVWTAKTILTRMPGWAMTGNASSEVSRALDVKRLGLAKTRELRPTDPERAFTVPEGLNLEDIEPGILDLERDANNYRFPMAGGAVGEATADAGFGSASDERLSASNNWVISGKKSATSKPLLANDPHRDVVNPSLRYVVHLNAPGWNAIGATEPGVPGIAVGHNERVAWGFTILGVDQQDLYVEETDPANPNRYQWKGEWRDMIINRELIFVKGQANPVEVTLKRTHHGPVVSENTAKHRAYAVRWAGAETGGAGYVGALGVMQSRNWPEFKANVARAWFIPSHSIVYADVDGNTGYLGVALSPSRTNWDGLLPVPGKDGRYEWEGYVPFEKLPASFNSPIGFYNTSNNDVVPKIVPGYDLALGFEYTEPFRYERVLEVLKSKPMFSLADMQALQQDTVSIPARTLVPLLLKLKFERPDLTRAQKLLAGWDFSLNKDSQAAAVYEFFQIKLPALAYAPRLPETERASFKGFDQGRVVKWMTRPDEAYGRTPKERFAGRDRILAEAFAQAVAHLVKLRGDDPKRWAWGDLHTADFVHPLSGQKRPPAEADVFAVTPARRGGDGYTVMASGGASETSPKQRSGASFSFVADLADWDRSTFLSAPGESAQPLSPFYSNLVESWAAGTGNALAFSRKKVDEIKANALMLQPIQDRTAPSADEPFEPVQKDLFAAAGGQPIAVADFDNDGDLDAYVGFRGAPSRLYRNEGGRFVDVAPALGLEEGDEVRAAAWGDYNGDGHLDLYGGVGATLLDYDNDGDLDLYLGNYGPNTLFRNDGGGKFTEVAASLGVAGDYHATTVVAGDYDNDGREDIYVASYLTGIMHVRDYLYHNDGPAGFSDRLPSYVARHDATHGVQFFDFDQDGDLDLMLADNLQYGSNALFRNRLSGANAARSLEVQMVEAGGHLTRAGSEVRLYKAGTKELLGTRIVDTGGGYCSQNAMPVHFGLGAYAGPVDVELTSFKSGKREITRMEGVDPSAPSSRPVLRVR